MGITGRECTSTDRGAENSIKSARQTTGPSNGSSTWVQCLLSSYLQNKTTSPHTHTHTGEHNRADLFFSSTSWLPASIWYSHPWIVSLFFSLSLLLTHMHKKTYICAHAHSCFQTSTPNLSRHQEPTPWITHEAVKTITLLCRRLWCCVIPIYGTPASLFPLPTVAHHPWCANASKSASKNATFRRELHLLHDSSEQLHTHTRTHTAREPSRIQLNCTRAK